MDAAQAARLVRRRGEFMLEAGEERRGTMMVVIGPDDEVVREACLEASNGESVVVAANIHAPGQVVISGDPAAVQRAGDLLTARGAKRVLPLNVSGAFHSPLMEPAQRQLRTVLAEAALAAPRFPVIANVSAEPVHGADDATRLLGDQLTSPVRWMESMVRARETAGLEVPFVEIGPGSVLSGLLRRIDRTATSTAVGTADQIQAFLEQAG